MNKAVISEIIKIGLIEDINNIDVTTDNLISEMSTCKATLTVKEDGVISGLDIARQVFKTLDSNIKTIFFVKDGAGVEKGDKLFEIEGKTKAILKGERLALNIIQRMSGISTQASKYAKLVEGINVKIVDTRKTTPGLRILEKYAVKAGGCFNHRYNLSDAVMIKDNHIKAACGITNAVKKIKENISIATKIEVEVQTIDQLKEALEAKVDIIMLDNMSVAMMKEAVEIANGEVLLEASGCITKDNLVEVAKTGVNIISVGALTHSVKTLDISLNIDEMY
ncbi:carboxylating nicotinate-nucleotide diphosphorylase [Alkaliphilus transvaalensis]|nr:carboxylating nicotinate-nucleotide diphosphorylase [Alkaliphilus transvaalensis]